MLVVLSLQMNEIHAESVKNNVNDDFNAIFKQKSQKSLNYVLMQNCS